MKIRSKKFDEYSRLQQMSENQVEIFVAQIDSLQEMIETNDAKLKDFNSRESLSDTEELTLAALEMQQTSLNAQLSNAQAQVEILQSDAQGYQSQLEAIEKSLSSEASSAHSLKRVVKMMIVGALIGFVFGVVVAGMRYMAKHTIEDEEELLRRYQLPVLTSLNNEMMKRLMPCLPPNSTFLAQSNQKPCHLQQSF